MEERKLDINTVIGFVLLFGIMIWYFYQNQPTPEEIEAQKQAEIEQVEAAKQAKEQDESLTAITTPIEDYNENVPDSLKQAMLQNKLGDLAYAYSLGS